MKSLISALSGLTSKKRRIFIDSLSKNELNYLLEDWLLWANDAQLPPLVKQGAQPWRNWLFMGGRGAGKTRAGAEWVRALACGHPEFTTRAISPIALVGETLHDARNVMVEGESGILNLHYQHGRPLYLSVKRCVEFANGARLELFSAEDPESLRGPQFEAAWADEIGKWRYAQQAWDMLQLGVRLGVSPKIMASTTPRPTPLILKLLEEPTTVVTRATTYENAKNLSSDFVKFVEQRYGHSHLGRQELMGEVVTEVPGALWQRSQIEQCRLQPSELSPDTYKRVIVAVDPPAGSGTCGIVVAAMSQSDQILVLEDGSLDKPKPLEWATQAITLYHRWQADALVCEINQGGDMVKQIISQVDDTVPVKAARATRSKWMRAEPVSALYAQNRVRHVGSFIELEDQMCALTPDGLALGSSPDRLDALVWAISFLTGIDKLVPRIRAI